MPNEIFTAVAVLCSLDLGCEDAVARTRSRQFASPDSASEESAIVRKVYAGAGVDEDEFGSALAVRGDVMVATSPDATVDGKAYAGLAYIFVRDERGDWIERKRLAPDDAVSFDQFGDHVAVDGDTVAVSASFARVGSLPQRGAVYVFGRNHGGQDNWGQVAKLTRENSRIADRFGSSVAIEGDLLAVGASRAADIGTVTVFERNRGGTDAWGTVDILSDGGDGGFPLELFGAAVAIEGDLLVVGAPSADVSYFHEDDGAVYVFRRSVQDRDQWNLVTRLTSPEAAVCPGGRTLVELSLESPEVQMEAARCAEENSVSDHDSFGARVAITGDTIAITAPGTENANGEGVGAVYVYQQDAGGLDRWDLTARLSGEDVGAGVASGFAGPIALVGNNLLVGAAVALGPNGDQGAVYVLTRAPEGAEPWSVTSRILAADGLAGERFGANVAFDGFDPVIAATRYGAARGAVYFAAAATLPEPAFLPTGELTEGGIVTGPDGSMLGAVPTTLAATLPVWLVEVDPPEVPFDWNATAIGRYYNLGSSVTTVAPNAAPFAVGLPVPAGADTSQLAAAVLVPADDVLDGPAEGSHWIATEGSYDPSRQLFSFALDSLTREGNTVILMEDPDVAPLLSFAGPSALSDAAPEFEFSCHGFSEANVCDADVVLSSQLALGAAHSRLTGLSYENPALRTHGVRLNDSGQFEAVPAVKYVGNRIVPNGPGLCADHSGWYSQQRIGLCWPPSADLTTLARHELFHAFQFGFDAVAKTARFASGENRDWIMEGTATAAENSATEMLREIFYLPHRIDHALTSLENADAYRAQDFWVYFGRKMGLGLDYLKPLFERGATTDAASAFFAEVHQTSLGEEYWEWIQDQAFEKDILFSAGGRAPCQVSEDLILGDVKELTLPVIGSEGTSDFACAAGKLDRLTGKVVRLKVLADLAETTVNVTSSGGGTLKYKIYLDQVCEPKPAENQPRTFDALAQDQTIIVLLANTAQDANKRVSFTVEAKLSDSVQGCSQ